MKLSDLFEGGGAMKGMNVERIKREDVPPTVQYVSKLAGIPVKDLHPLGSTGKNPTSGDIDLGIDINKYDPEELHKRMLAKLGNQRATFNKGIKVGSYAVEIAGDKSKGFVQVDFMYVPDTKWASFSYHSAGEKSKYKGVVRTILLRSVASALDEKGTDMFVYDAKSNDLMIRVGRTMDMNTGLRRIIQLRPKKKSGEGYLSTMKTVSMDELEAAYPGLYADVGEFATITNPKDALKVMFGFSVDPSEVETAEQLVELIKKLPSERKTRVMKTVKENLIEKLKFTEDQIKELFGE